MYKIALKIGKAQAADDFPDPGPLLSTLWKWLNESLQSLIPI